MQEENSELQSPCTITPNETGQTLVMENKIATIANLQTLQCLLCQRKLTSMTNLHRHLANHMGWYRYGCVLCDFKCFVKCDCIAHCNKIHNAQNNRAIIADLMVEISQNDYTHDKGIVDTTSVIEKNKDNFEIVDITASSNSVEEHERKSNDSNDASAGAIISHDETTVASGQDTAESRKDIEKKREDSSENTTVQDLTEYMMNCGSKKLDTHPDLKRIVMEVIFGSNETNTIKQTEFDKPVLDTDSDTGKSVSANGIASTDEAKKTTCLVSARSPKRSARNRIKPLNDDFIYNLNEKTQKVGAFFRKSSSQLNKSSTKKHRLHLSDSEVPNAPKKAKLLN